MGTYSIHPLHCGVINSDMTKGGLTYLVDEGVPVSIPVVVFVITADDPDDDRVAVVDVGAEAGTVSGREIHGGGPEPIREGLADLDLTPEDVDEVVLTHLHHDHAANVDLFPDAEVFLQRSEWAAANDPLPPMERVYLDRHIAAVEAADLTLVDGGFRLSDGLELLHAPGHTEGMQAVLVETAAGPHAIVSDLVYCRQNLEPDVTQITDVTGREVETTPVDYDYLPPGLHVSVTDCYDSIDRIRERVGPNGVFVGGHDAGVLEGSYPR